MELPIDVCRAPFKPKYLDEETQLLNGWFIFGTSDNGVSVDISDGNMDVMIHVPKDMATRIVAARDVFVNAMLKELTL